MFLITHKNSWRLGKVRYVRPELFLLPDDIGQLDRRGVFRQSVIAIALDGATFTGDRCVYLGLGVRGCLWLPVGFTFV
jgi:hypothetical protein